MQRIFAKPSGLHRAVVNFRQKRSNYNNDGGGSSKNGDKYAKYGIAGAVSIAGGCPVAYSQREETTFVPDHKPKFAETCITKPVQANRPKPDVAKLPTIPLEEVQADHGERVWVTWDGGVFDVTEFLEVHPGGEARIKMANGCDLHAYWDLYRLHHRHHIQDLLQQYRIGNLTEEDSRRSISESNFGSMYGADPVRPKQKELRVPSVIPWNSEPPLNVLTDSFLTPNDYFFVRNHNAVPEIDEEDYELEIEANTSVGLESKVLTLEEIKKLPRHSVVSVIQCAGNRQEDFVTKDRALYVAPHWRGGAIGNALWTGVRLRDVLAHCGMKVDDMALGKFETPEARIVNFVAYDTDETGNPYAGIIPVEKAVDPFGDALLAFEMNGETLPRDHGYPLRLVAPGHAGCRNVKWLKNISVTAKPSELDAGSKLDRHFAPDVSFENHIRYGDDYLRLDQGPAMQSSPVQSIICQPLDGTTIGCSCKGGSRIVEMKGIAYSGAGRGIVRIEVSCDGGKEWHCAESIAPPGWTTEGKCIFHQVCSRFER